MALFSGKLLVNITVYADESGTHDTKGKQPGSQIATIGGYAGFNDDWIKFCGEWQAELDTYCVPYFHFSDFADKKRRAEDKNFPYYGWNAERLDAFLYGMASIAGNRVRFPFGPSLNLVVFNEPDTKNDLRKIGLSEVQINSSYIVYMACFHEFFDLFLEDLRIRLPDFNESISFVFEQNTDVWWDIAAHEMFKLFKQKDSRLDAIMFGDKRKFLPLQAADMIAYRLHQRKMNELKTGKEDIWKPLDHLLWGSYSPGEIKQIMEADAKRTNKK